MEKRFLGLMQGIGDQIWQRPILKEIFLDLSTRGITPYIAPSVPELWTDYQKEYGVKLVRSNTTLRTQKKHAVNALYDMEAIPDDLLRGIQNEPEKYQIVPEYGQKEIRDEKRTIITALEHTSGGTFYSRNMNLPHGIVVNPNPLKDVVPDDRPVAVVRPVTIRKEWMSPGRAPDPSTISWCSRVLRESGWFVVSIADVDGVNEWIDGAEPPADLKLHAGEINIPDMLNLIKKSQMVIGGSGFIVPAAIATKTPLFVIFGGRGGYDSPWTLFDPRMDIRKVGWAIPDNFSRGYSPIDGCTVEQKRISNLDSEFYRFIQRLQESKLIKV